MTEQPKFCRHGGTLDSCASCQAELARTIEQKQFCIHGCVGTCHYMQPGRDDKHDCCPYGHEPAPAAKSEQPIKYGETENGKRLLNEGLTSDTPLLSEQLERLMRANVDVSPTKLHDLSIQAEDLESALAAAKAENAKLRKRPTINEVTEWWLTEHCETQDEARSSLVTYIEQQRRKEG